MQLQASNSNSVDTQVDKTPTPIDHLPSCSNSCTPGPPRVPSDLGEDKPNQVKLRRFPLRLCYRSFVASWYTTREWLEYSVEADAAFCFPCRKYLISPSDSAMKCALTFGASTATCENSFSTLKNVFTDNRRSMLHQRKAQLVQLAFERDLTRKFRDEWKDTLLRRFKASKLRRLQLF